MIEVCPVEWARMEDRSVLQWDKDDCAAVGLVKFDLLGLGMLIGAALRRRPHPPSTAAYEVDLATIPQEDAVYDMLCRADSVGVFQVESRAQMATLPRLKPRTFYDLVVEVALIRPGPIQGGSVHPYIRRRNGTGAGHLPAPAARELAGQDARRAAVPGAADADGHRRRRVHRRPRPTSCARPWARSAAASAWSACARGSTRAWPSAGITGEVADEIFEKMAAFANFGFPESHSVSFAYLVYASSWIKLHEPAAFCAALLNAQPMGFYSPHSLVQDARRHGVMVRTPDLNASTAQATLEPCAESHHGVAVRLGHRLGASRRRRPGQGRSPPAGPYVEHGGPRAPGTGARRSPMLEALATAGAFGCFEDGEPPRRGAVGGGRGGPVAARTAWPASSPGPTRRRCRA